MYDKSTTIKLLSLRRLLSKLLFTTNSLHLIKYNHNIELEIIRILKTNKYIYLIY